MSKLAFVDVETTGLDPDVHEVWEVGLIVRDLENYRVGPSHLGDQEYLWQLPVDLGRADPVALGVGEFMARRWPATSTLSDGTIVAGKYARLEAAEASANLVERPCVLRVDQLEGWAATFAALTWGAILVGANPAFDDLRLGRLLRRWGACPGWHYRPIDVEALAVGYLHACADPTGEAAHEQRPWRHRDVRDALGIVTPEGAKHTALGDARLARDTYDRVVDVPRGTLDPCADCGHPWAEHDETGCTATGYGADPIEVLCPCTEPVRRTP